MLLYFSLLGLSFKSISDLALQFFIFIGCPSNHELTDHVINLLKNNFFKNNQIEKNSIK